MDRLDARMALCTISAEFVSLLTQARNEKSHAYAAERAEAIIKGIAEVVCIPDDERGSVANRLRVKALYTNLESLFKDSSSALRSHNWVAGICGKANTALIFL